MEIIVKCLEDNELNQEICFDYFETEEGEISCGVYF